VKKIALMLGLTISMSAYAFRPYGPDDILVMAGSDGSTLYMTFMELEAKIEDENPVQFEWCKHKGGIARSVLSSRDYMSREDILAELTPIKPKMKHFLWLELERITAEVYRYNSKGDFNIPQTLNAQQDIFAEEYQKCIAIGF